MKKAKKDQSAAKVNFREGLFEVAAFLSHQAAEKALKALYTKKFKRLWKTHDLIGILSKVNGNELLKACEVLNRHYIETRYPTRTEYDEEVAEDAINKAEEVVKWVKKR